MENIELLHLTSTICLILGIVFACIAVYMFINCKKKGYIWHKKRSSALTEPVAKRSDTAEELGERKEPRKQSPAAETKEETPAEEEIKEEPQEIEIEPPEEEMTGILDDDSTPTEQLEEGSEGTTALSKEQQGVSSSIRDNTTWGAPLTELKMHTIYSITLLGFEKSNKEGEMRS